MLIAPARSFRSQLFTVALLLSASTAFAQQDYVTRFDAFVGYGFLDSPHVSLFENGFAAQFGVRPKPWYSVGIDYTIATGDLTLTPNLLLPALQQQLGAELGGLAAAGQLPPVMRWWCPPIPGRRRLRPARNWRIATLSTLPCSCGRYTRE